jgi:hypothetical protein
MICLSVAVAGCDGCMFMVHVGIRLRPKIAQALFLVNAGRRCIS